MTIGNTLRNLRIQHKMSQEEVAERLGVKQSTIHNWESDKSSPSINCLPPLAALYNMQMEQICILLFGTSPSAP